MDILPKEIRVQIPLLYTTEQEKDPIVRCKLFCPWTDWTLLVTEFDGEDTLFGWVYSDYPEWGYSSLSELESVCGPFGLHIERDLYFKPCKMSVAQEQLYKLLGRI
jgi:hypothetical protein